MLEQELIISIRASLILLSNSDVVETSGANYLVEKPRLAVSN